MAWERKRKPRNGPADQLNEAEDTITEMGDKVATLSGSWRQRSTLRDSQGWGKSVNAEKAEVARDLKDEQVRVLGAVSHRGPCAGAAEGLG